MYKRIDFSKLEGLATYQDTLDFLQISYREAISAVAKAFGSKVIVTGVTDQGLSYSDGWIIIDGELMPFTGGLKTDRIVVDELTDTEIFNDGSIQTVYYTKRAKLGITGGFAFTDFIRVDTLSAISLGLKNLVAAHNNLQSAFNTHSHSWNDITNKPSTFTPSGHRHNWNDIDNKPYHNIVYGRSFDFGDIGREGGNDWTWEPFPFAIHGNYVVAGTLRSYGTLATDNNGTWMVRDKSANGFTLVLQDNGGGQQFLGFDYVIISL
jgi:hypothetical protein